MEKDVEIERKFVVADRTVLEGSEGCGLIQGYLQTSTERTIRVRIDRNEVAVLTVKGPRVGATRYEAECSLPVGIAEQILAECRQPLIIKTRYPVVAGGRMWVIDEFHDANEGLLLAEIELASESEDVIVPEWCGSEVTTDERYYNENLVAHPYRSWEHGS
ncbi:MAG TPA: CYTH domain-containing protein [Mycobacterium sp.]|nr:CYTH domain-containing protein [Mycobacterium sp.]